MDTNRVMVIIWRGLRLTPLLFLGVFFFYPLGAIFRLSFAPDGVLDVSIFREIATTDYYQKTLWFTVWQAVLSTLLTLALAMPAAHVFTRYQFPTKNFLLGLATLPFVLPTVVVATAFRALIGEQGLINTLATRYLEADAPLLEVEQSLSLILLAHVFYNYAVAVRIISTFWAQQNQRMQEVAFILGATRWQVFYRITLPLLLPAIAAAGVLVFMFTFTSFGVILLLGGFRYATVEVEIYQQAVVFFDLPAAAALSLIQLGLTLFLLMAYTALQNRVSVAFTGFSSRVARPPQTLRERVWVGGNVALMAGLILAPLIALVVQSVNVGLDSPSLTYYDRLSENRRGSALFVPPLEAVWNSLQFALITMIFAVVLGVLAAYLLKPQRGSRWLDPLFMLPLATSAVTLGFGYIIALDEPPLNLRNSFWIIPLAHTLVAMPFVIRTVLPTLRSLRPALTESAIILGAAPWVSWWRIELPLISRNLLVGAIFAFTISMGEFGASAFIARAQKPTIPMVIFRLLGLPNVGNYGQALAMSVILMAVCAVSFGIMERLSRQIERTDS